MTGRGIIRRAQAKDLAAASRCHAESFNALNLQHGYPDQLYSPATVNPYFRFALDDPSTAFWVAEVGDEVRGLGIASVFDDVWFLSHLFVDPTAQGCGLGKRLLEQTMDDEQLPGANNQALVTMAYNPISLELYAQYGLQPRTMIYRVEATSRSITVPHLEPSALVPAAEGRSCLASVLRSVDLQSLSLDRPWHHRFFLTCSNARCLLLRRGDEVEGYAYVWDDGRIGPAAARSESEFRELFSAGVTEANRQSVGRVSTFASSASGETLDLILQAGMHITLPFVLLSTKALRPVRSYVFHSPGLL
ncbi:MAG: GNAT family N-acetyltransferase [Candidatus Bipolaricaulota bacterium]